MSNPLLRKEYPVDSGVFESAGDCSSDIKATLKKLGLPSALIRRVSIAAYEAEINLIIHSHGGELILEVNPEGIRLVCRDVGPGMKDVEKAMQEGWSTAPDSVRLIGLGAGMGLPNMKRNTDVFDIQSVYGSGTTITMDFHTA
jgi:anti-sigma regulatory factor (Ser/Thr protein kinase)